MLVAALLMSLYFVGTSQAQGGRPAYGGKFTLTDPIHWGRSVPQPDDYTITIDSTSNPVFALIRDGQGRAVGRVMSEVCSDNTTALNALLMKEKDGQLWCIPWRSRN